MSAERTQHIRDQQQSAQDNEQERAILVPLTEREWQAIQKWQKHDDFPLPIHVIKQALRYYDKIKHRQLEGQHVAFVDKDGNLVAEPITGCMGDE